MLFPSWLVFLGTPLAAALTLNVGGSLSTPATSHVSQNPSNLLSPLPSLINSTSSSTSLDNRVLRVVCDPAPPDLEPPNYRESCRDAVRHLNTVSGPAGEPYTWATRDQRWWVDIPLPQRAMSSDHRCAVEVYIHGYSQGIARADFDSVQNAATQILNKCVVSEGRRGGSAGNFEAQDILEVDIEEFGPDELASCYGPMHAMEEGAEASCTQLLDRMPTSKNDLIFGPSTYPGVQVDLPFTMVSRDGKCKLTITTEETGARNSWWSFWQGGIDLAAKCVRQGKQGRSEEFGTGIGASKIRNLRLTL